jgi:hypothetical protein
VIYAHHAFLYSGGIMQDLGTLGGSDSEAFARPAGRVGFRLRLDLAKSQGRKTRYGVIKRKPKARKSPGLAVSNSRTPAVHIVAAN